MRSFIAGLAVFVASPSFAGPAVDSATAKAVIARCISIYKESGHPCACPFDKDKRGGACGRRSAHDRAGGAEPVCEASEITPELVKDFRTNEQAVLRGRCEYGER